MTVTNTDNQALTLKEKIKKIYHHSEVYHDTGFCPASDILSPSLERWSMFCLFNLTYHGTLRFGELRKNIGGISARMLSVTLKRLEENGLVNREAFTEVPPKVEYSLTEFGHELSIRLADLSYWFLEQYAAQQKK